MRFRATMLSNSHALDISVGVYARVLHYATAIHVCERTPRICIEYRAESLARSLARCAAIIIIVPVRLHWDALGSCSSSTQHASRRRTKWTEYLERERERGWKEGRGKKRTDRRERESCRKAEPWERKKESGSTGLACPRRGTSGHVGWWALSYAMLMLVPPDTKSIPGPAIFTYLPSASAR